MQLTINSLNRYNCQELSQQVDKLVSSQRLIIDFTQLYNIDQYGYRAFLDFKNKTLEKGIQLFVLGKENHLLQQFEQNMYA